MTEEQNDLVITRGCKQYFLQHRPIHRFKFRYYTISSQALLESGVASVVFDGATYNAPSKDLKGTVDLALRILILILAHLNPMSLKLPKSLLKRMVRVTLVRFKPESTPLQRVLRFEFIQAPMKKTSLLIIKISF